MPHRAKQICGAPGCGAICEGRYCAAHLRRNPRVAFDRERGSAHARGYGRRWQRLRKLVLARDPLCMIQVLCGRGVDALPAPSTEADHIVPRSRGGEESMENLQGACHACHSHKTATEDSAFAAAKRG